MNSVLTCFSALILIGHSAESQSWDEWKTVMDRGNAAERAGDYAAAAGAYHDAVRLTEHYAPNDRRHVYSWNALAMMYDALGRLPDGAAAYRRSLAAAERSTGKGSPDYALIQGNLASLYVEMGQTARGEEMVRKSLASYAAMEHPDEVRIAMARNILAEILLLSRKIREADDLLTASLAVLVKHPEAWTETAVGMNNMGVVRTYQRRFGEAEQLLRRAISMMEEHMGIDHPMLVRTLNNMATLLYQSGRRDEAGQALQRAVTIAETRLGGEHPIYGAVLQNYAEYLRDAGDKAGAKTLQARAAKVLRESRRINGMGSVVDISALRQK
jgi:tetratricopeptide (TPR) repeat protein